MKKKLETFIAAIDEFESKPKSRQIDYFVYFCTVELHSLAAPTSQVLECFDNLNLSRYSNVKDYLSKNSKSVRGKKQRFIKKGNEFSLERKFRQELEEKIDTGPAKIIVKKSLTDLLTKINDPDESDFLQEAIKCYEVDAKRAAIIMVWNLTIFHLYGYILNNKLSEFNLALAKDKGVKRSSVSKIDDFQDIKEIKFIELAKAADIIKNNVRKILDVKLGIRNTYAHPSDTKISEEKANEFIKDLIENVVLKY